jgi:hypothetical protein
VRYRLTALAAIKKTAHAIQRTPRIRANQFLHTHCDLSLLCASWVLVTVFRTVSVTTGTAFP